MPSAHHCTRFTSGRYGADVLEELPPPEDEAEIIVVNTCT